MFLQEMVREELTKINRYGRKYAGCFLSSWHWQHAAYIAGANLT